MFRVIKPGKAAILKVANWRKKGRLVTFTRDTIEACEAAGFVLHDELICVEPAPLGLAFPGTSNGPIDTSTRAIKLPWCS